MKLLKTITEKDIFPESRSEFPEKDYRERFAARAIVFDNENNVALLHVSKHNYYKLPGGGVEKGEDVKEALQRECLEEIGCNISVRDEVGEILEFRNEELLKQTSYCFIAQLDGEKGNPDFEQGEVDDGFEPIWVSLDKAIELIKNSKPTVYNGHFIVARDQVFLETVQSAL